MKQDNDLVLVEWQKFVANRPKVDMNSCVHGQLLLTSKGKVVRYLENVGDRHFPHVISFGGQARGTRTNEGWTYVNNPLPTDEDIVYIFPPEKTKKNRLTVLEKTCRVNEL